MNILFIAPLPPPFNGQSFAAEKLYLHLIKNHDVKLVNMAKPKRVTNFVDWFGRFFVVISFFIKVFFKKNKTECIYLTISESRFGNIKDLIIYLICFRKLGKMTIHLLGGAGMRKIIENEDLITKINSFFFKRINSVIVEGKIQSDFFSKLVDPDRIHIIPNFADDFLFINPEQIKEKFYNLDKIRILFLSNLIYGKGYIELLEAYNSLTDDLKSKIELTFVGGFHSDKSRNEFIKQIENQPEVKYLGSFIGGIEKKELYMKSHIFCLPTYYPYEGQPISILEAYATGCVVVTTNHSGIPQIFSDIQNGFLVDKQSPDSIRLALEKIIFNKGSLSKIALNNLTYASRFYRSKVFTDKINKILINKSS